MARFDQLDQLIAKLSANGKSSSKEVETMDAQKGGFEKNATSVLFVAVKP